MKWLRKDRTKIENLAKRFNAKISRLSVLKPYLAEFLPDVINVKEYANSIKAQNSRSFYNRELRRLQRFLKPDAERLVQTPNITTIAYEKDTARYNLQYRNRIRMERLKKIADEPAFIAGEKQPISRGRIGKMEELQNATASLDIFTFKNNAEWEAFGKNLMNQISPDYVQYHAERYKDNYKMALEAQFGVITDDVINEKLSALYERIDSLSWHEIDYIYTHDIGADIKNVYIDTVNTTYDQIEELAMSKLDELMKVWGA